MSKYGMLGLLEGLGKGVSGMGEAMEKNNLLAAQEAKAMNLARIQRQWNTEDRAAENAIQVARDETNYTREVGRDETNFNRGVAQDDKNYGRLQTENDRDYNRNVAEQDKQNNWTLKNRQASESDKQLARADKALADGVITQAQYNSISLGLTNKAEGALTEKDRAELKINAFKEASTRYENMQDGPEKETAVNRLAGKLYNSATGDGLLERGAGGEGTGTGNPAADPKADRAAFNTEFQALYKTIPPEKQKAFLAAAASKYGETVVADAVVGVAGTSPGPAPEEEKPKVEPPPTRPGGKSPIEKSLDRGRAMTPEERAEAAKKRKERLGRSFGVKPFNQ